MFCYNFFLFLIKEEINQDREKLESLEDKDPPNIKRKHKQQRKKLKPCMQWSILLIFSVRRNSLWLCYYILLLETTEYGAFLFIFL